MGRRIAPLIVAPLFAAFFGLQLDVPAYAARLLKGTVERDGKVVLTTHFSDDGKSSPEELWNRLRGDDCRWQIESEEVAIEPSWATVEGALAIRIYHGGTPLFEARASKISLRGPPEGDEWFLPADEFDRISAANGIANVRPASAKVFAPLWIIAGGFLLLVVVVLVFLATGSRRSSSVANE
jgi:hypothetical protein